MAQNQGLLAASTSLNQNINSIKSAQVLNSDGFNSSGNLNAAAAPLAYTIPGLAQQNGGTMNGTSPAVGIQNTTSSPVADDAITTASKALLPKPMQTTTYSPLAKL